MLVIARVNEFSRQLADRAADIARQMFKEGIDHPLVPRLSEALAKRAADCQKILV